MSEWPKVANSLVVLKCMRFDAHLPIWNRRSPVKPGKYNAGEAECEPD